MRVRTGDFVLQSAVLTDSSSRELDEEDVGVFFWRILVLLRPVHRHLRGNAGANRFETPLLVVSPDQYEVT